MRSPARRLFVAGLLLLAPAGLTRAEQPKPPEPKLPAGAKLERDLVYGPHERNQLDLYLPKKADGPTPLIVWVHGGGWRGGSKDNPPGLGMLNRGFAVASINYRLSQHAIFPAQIEDCKAAVRFLRANAKKYNLDADRFGAWGASAGGHLVALLGTSGGAKELEGDGRNKDVSSKVQAVCDWFGPTDLSKIAEQSGPDIVLKHNDADAPGSKLLGGPIPEKKDLAQKANPIKYITKDTPPFLIVHGDKDELVPLAQSQILHDALKAAKVESTLHVVKGGGHGKNFGEPERKAVLDFFEKHLKK